jgi:hypothetical protein
MKWNCGWARVAGMCLASLLSAQGQQPRSVNVTGAEAAPATSMMAHDNRIAVPRLIKFNGTLTDFSGNPLNGTTEVTFTLYKQESDTEPVWTETQIVQFDSKGNYTVLLGSTQSEGLPVELFASSEAHWLGVEVQGQPLPPRTLLVSVPYALRAVEAEKLGGKSLSDFVLSENLGDQVRQVIETQSAAQPALANTSQAQPASNGLPQSSAPNPPAVFSGSNTSQIVLVQQKGSGAGLVSLTTQNVALSGHSAGGTGSTGVLGQTGGTSSNGVAGIAMSTSTSTNQNGVYGQNDGGGAGVAGISNSTSAVGVYGQSPGFAGIYGQGTGYAGVYGQSSGYAGVFGSNVATSGPATGVAGDGSASPTGSGVTGSSNLWVGVGGSASATSGIPAYGVWGNSQSTSGVAIAGFEDATTGSTIGVYGTASSSSGAAIYGNAAATSGGTAGVVGQVLSPNGTAGVFIDLAGQGLILQGISGTSTVFTVDANGNLTMSGNLIVNGTKSSTAKLEDGREVALYAVESPENWFEDFGSGELSNGVAWIPLDASFAQSTNTALAYHVYLTPNGDSNGLYVARKTATGFEVREHGGGASKVAFDFRVVARRRGYESVRMAEVHHPKTEVSSQLLSTRPMKIPAASLRPGTKPAPIRPIAP